MNIWSIYTHLFILYEFLNALVLKANFNGPFITVPALLIALEVSFSILALQTGDTVITLMALGLSIGFGGFFNNCLTVIDTGSISFPG